MKKNYYLFTCSFFFSLGNNILGFSLIFRLADWYSFSAGQIGTFIALGQLCYFLGCNLYHRFGSLYDPVKILTFASIVVFCSVLPLSFIKVQIIAYISYWAFSLANGLFWPPLMASLTGGLSDEALNLELSIFNRSWMSSNIIGPLVAGSLYRWSSGITFLLICISFFIVNILFFFLKRHSLQYGEDVDMPAMEHNEKPAEHSTAGAPDSASEHPKPPLLKSLDSRMDHYRYKGWLSGFFAAMFIGVLVNIIPLHIRDSLGHSERSIGFILFFRSLMGFIGFTVLAKFTAWQFSRRWFIILQSALVFCTFLLLISGSHLSLYFIIVLFYGLIHSACYNNSIFYSSATGRDPKKNLALHEIILCSGSAIGTAGGGFIYQHFKFTGMSLTLLLILGLGLGVFILLDRRESH